MPTLLLPLVCAATHIGIGLFTFILLGYVQTRVMLGIFTNREDPLMMSDFRGGWGSEMNPKIRTFEGKNQTLGGMGGQKL